MPSRRRPVPSFASPPAAPAKVADLQAELRSHGLRSTSPRLAVLAHLQRATSPLSHGEITEALAGHGFDRATVYRNLMDLADKGILARSDLGDHVWRFELRGKESHASGHGTDHPHFVCTDCGDIECLPPVAVRVVGAEGTPRALAQKTVEVQVKGLCDDCGPSR
jgi:Fur family ferric uptake transcriptional regulator